MLQQIISMQEITPWFSRLTHLIYIWEKWRTHLHKYKCCHTSIVTICCNSDTQHASCQYLEYKIIAQAMDIILQGRWNDTCFQTTTLSHIKQTTLSQSKRDESDSKIECVLYQPKLYKNKLLNTRKAALTHEQIKFNLPSTLSLKLREQRYWLLQLVTDTVKTFLLLVSSYYTSSLTWLKLGWTICQ